MKFIKLTGLDDKKILVNIESVVNFYECKGGKILVTYTSGYGEYVKESIDKILKLIDGETPSAKWIIDDYNTCICSKCNDFFFEEEYVEVFAFKFCPSCGAKMS